MGVRSGVLWRDRVPGVGLSEQASASPDRPPLALRELGAYFLRLGSLGFGGPIALAGYMQRDLVERRGWVTQEEYLQGLAAAQTLPGPLAAQLAMWLGYLRRGFWGATVAAFAFILPPFLIVTLVAALYVALSGTLADPETVSAGGLSGSDSAAVEALDIFAAAYGAAAGNLAITLLATGGVYLAGGIAPLLIDKLKDGTFLEAFRRKGRLEPVLARIPVHVIMSPAVALLGAGAVAAGG